MDAAKLCAQQPRQPRPVGSWASIVVDSFDSKAILLAIEAKEASQHLVGLLMLVGVVVVLASSSILTYSGFLLYLVPLLLHLAWGWNALISAERTESGLGRCFLSTAATSQAGFSDGVKRS